MGGGRGQRWGCPDGDLVKGKGRGGEGAKETEGGEGRGGEGGSKE
jgi:hypothetical protein